MQYVGSVVPLLEMRDGDHALLGLANGKIQSTRIRASQNIIIITMIENNMFLSCHIPFMCVFLAFSGI